MGTKPNLNFSPTNNFISNSLFAPIFHFPVPMTRSPLPVLAELHARARASRALYLKENGNLSMPENLVMTSAYARTFVRTLGQVLGVGLE